jgi:hypothetical protein
MKVRGIGRNLATKLVAVHLPEDCVVINDPVERALRSFGCSSEALKDMNARSYRNLLSELAPFTDECYALRLQQAAALDAFFWWYANKSYGAEAE